MAGEDFVHIKLSAAGERLAGEGKRVQLAHGRRHFDFTVGEPQRIDRSYEWGVLLRNEKHEGEAIFEIAPAAAVAAVAENQDTIEEKD